jgi:hypothetical protein
MIVLMRQVRRYVGTVACVRDQPRQRRLGYWRFIQALRLNPHNQSLIWNQIYGLIRDDYLAVVVRFMAIMPLLHFTFEYGMRTAASRSCAGKYFARYLTQRSLDVFLAISRFFFAEPVQICGNPLRARGHRRGQRK